MRVLGVSAYASPSAAALVVDGRPVAAFAEESASRVRGDDTLPRGAIAGCLASAAAGGDGIDALVFAGKPLLQMERVLLALLGGFPSTWRGFPRTAAGWLGDRLWVKGELARLASLPTDRVLFVPRHRALAAAAFFASPAPRASILTVEPGEWGGLAFGKGGAADPASIALDAELELPHSPSLVLNSVARLLGLDELESEEALDDLAASGVARFRDRFDRLFHAGEDGLPRVDARTIPLPIDERPRPSARFAAAFADLPLDGGWASDAAGKPEDLSPGFRAAADLAASARDAVGDALVRLARRLRREGGERALCLGGAIWRMGSLVGRVAAESGFEEVFVQPAPGAAGAALGAALEGHRLLGGGRPRAADDLLLGWGLDPSVVDDLLRNTRFRRESFDSDAKLVARAASALRDARVLGWVEGRAEFGGRSLGARAIVADPAAAGAARRLNGAGPHRPPFRRFAYSCASAALEGTEAARAPARFGLLAAPTANAGVARRPDGTAWIHAADGSPPRYRALLDAMGGSALLAPFALAGEPAAGGAAQCYSAFARSRLDGLVMGDSILWSKGGTSA